MVERKIGDKRLRMVEGDITDIEVEAFVFDITEDAQLGSGFGVPTTVRTARPQPCVSWDPARRTCSHRWRPA